MKILFAASEGVPFIKTGGLADVIGSLPKELIKQGLDVRVVLPKYGDIPLEFRQNMVLKKILTVPLGWRRQYCGIFELEYQGVPFYFIDNEYYFKRPGLYGFYDDAERFAFFCKAVLEMLNQIDFQPDILHCHDWHTGMIPAFLRAHYRHLINCTNIRTLYTIHNLQYQGVYPKEILEDIFGLDQSYFTLDTLEFYGQVSFMKGGINFSDRITTVSPTYAQEIQYSFYGEKLEGLLRHKNDILYGIINGIDYDEYNPFTDTLIYHRYDQNYIAGKLINKEKLQQHLGLPVKSNVPLIGVVSRLVGQKGFDLVAHVLEKLLEQDVQLVVLGSGEHKYESLFNTASQRYPEKVSANLFFSDELAHKIYAGSDLFLMPSLFEPCGLGQIIALRYGSVPIVRETGGLKDTVCSYDEYTCKGNGFSFQNYNADDMLYTIRRALSFYGQTETWARIRNNALNSDFGWYNSAQKYKNLYIDIMPKVKIKG